MISEVPFLVCLEVCKADKYKIVMARVQHKHQDRSVPLDPPPPYGPPVPSHAICSKAIETHSIKAQEVDPFTISFYNLDPRTNIFSHKNMEIDVPKQTAG